MFAIISALVYLLCVLGGQLAHAMRAFDVHDTVCLVYTILSAWCSYCSCTSFIVELRAHAADVYAFGVLCWEMFTGQRAWSGMHCTQIVIAVTIGQRRLLLPPEAGAAFRDLVQQCMSDLPADRPNFQARC